MSEGLPPEVSLVSCKHRMWMPASVAMSMTAPSLPDRVLTLQVPARSRESGMLPKPPRQLLPLFSDQAGALLMQETQGMGCRLSHHTRSADQLAQLRRLAIPDPGSGRHAQLALRLTKPLPDAPTRGAHKLDGEVPGVQGPRQRLELVHIPLPGLLLLLRLLLKDVQHAGDALTDVVVQVARIECLLEPLLHGPALVPDHQLARVRRHVLAVGRDTLTALANELGKSPAPLARLADRRVRRRWKLHANNVMVARLPRLEALDALRHTRTEFGNVPQWPCPP